MTKLKKCPYCGAKDQWNLRTRVISRDFFAIRCAMCRASGPAARTINDARKGWNDRSYKITPMTYIVVTVVSILVSAAMRIYLHG